MAGVIGKVSTTTARSAEITVWGLRSLDRALKDLAPDLRRDLYQSIGSVSKEIAIEAQDRTRALSAMGDRSPIGANANVISSSVKNRKNRQNAKGKRSRAGLFGFSIIQPHGYGALAEFARNAKTPQGKALVEAFSRKLGPYSGGRFLWAAMDSKRDDVTRKVSSAVAAIESELQRRVDAMTIGTA